MTRASKVPRETPRRFGRAIAAGASSVPSRFVKEALAALVEGDSAGDTLALGIDGGSRFFRGRSEFLHQIWVGDWDSLGSPPAVAGVDFLHLPPEKDRSDLACGLAVLHALQTRGDARFREIVLFGVTGGRPDHHLASLIEIVDAASEFREPVLFRLLEPGCEWFCIHARRPLTVSVSTRKGETVSLFSLDGRARIGGLRGLKFTGTSGKTGFSLHAGSHGLSNVATGGRVEVRLVSGTLLGVLPGGGSRGARNRELRDWQVKTGKST